MSEQVPTIGCIVRYTLNATDASAINGKRATDPSRHGNMVYAGDTYPMTIVRVWGDSPGAAVNGQVILDGDDTHWVTSRCGGDGDGQYSWPERV